MPQRCAAAANGSGQEAPPAGPNTAAALAVAPVVNRVWYRMPSNSASNAAAQACGTSYGVMVHNSRVTPKSAAGSAQVSASSWAPGTRRVDRARSAAKA
ncbi:hypothetical protein I1A62_00560 (plasmid) [Rhodococcus sp. USK10]|uniref:hypothetical protein n=1 Tax=Rhodococcus sp. USK10 TaxID=2789739 RepID=UPI001C5CF418|nr:hypothetical protein [Rhodococcus sp. USK10]QYA99651.1 hypothetical protein I1A62_00560 [Rhodococcus sp. USK10]